MKPSWDSCIEAKQFPREMWLAVGRQGLLGLEIPEQQGGSEAGDFRSQAVLCEELGGVSMSLPPATTSTPTSSPYLVELTTKKTKQLLSKCEEF